ncbi:MAG: hypothetical protein A2086_04935 [Spirochaetes bacterium GWD1_27_9]|nr:MAG: hypothetical protein A2Z98_06930 [Spirochaetes bacterium GWB1_27_13]OHD21481.1 MAG: hypothetical protein A2Y34_01360 [Spirochaetes bacterium GWC1_27_15]OHD42453.1 MAG: hypothetical protein A2086_04935 [Spirochaetes bacterium GWD1_27_9]
MPRDLEKVISKTIGKSIFNYKMIEENDRILIAVSGGKDSMTLLYDLINRKKSFPIKYEIHAIHIKSDFCKCCEKLNLVSKFEEWNVPYSILDVNILKRLKPGKKMNCYWCSMQRRMELIKYARENNFNKIALGHHLDDIIETLFLNMFYKGEMSTMLPSLKYDKYDITIIRPLALVKESQIIKFAQEKGIANLVCTCVYGKNSKRKEIKKVIKEFAKDDIVKYNIFNSMQNVNGKYML